jgi:hypothetical protein
MAAAAKTKETVAAMTALMDIVSFVVRRGIEQVIADRREVATMTEIKAIVSSDMWEVLNHVWNVRTTIWTEPMNTTNLTPSLITLAGRKKTIAWMNLKV